MKMCRSTPFANPQIDMTLHTIWKKIVYNELIYMGYEVSVFRKEKQEIDFIALKKEKEYLVQVAYSVAEDSTYEREMALFNTLDNSRRKILITTDPVDISTSTVQHITLQKFLEMEDLEN